MSAASGWAEQYLREHRSAWEPTAQRAIELVLDLLDQYRDQTVVTEGEFSLWPDCCRRTGNWSRRRPRLFRCPTCGEVMHTKLDHGALHHQRLNPGSDIYVTHKFRHFDETDESDFGMYVGAQIDAHRGESHWPHYELRATRSETS